MNNKHTSENPQANQVSGVSEQRRRLLRAAATAAPLVATIPNGAAWANASTAQCILDGQPTAPIPPEVEIRATGPLPAEATPDNFLRVQGLYQEWTNGSTPSFYYKIGDTWYAAPPDQTTPAIAIAGSPADPPLNLVLTSETNVLLLKYYKPDDEVTTVTDQCDLSSAGATAPNDCVWPITTSSVGDGLNQGMAGSCMCSVNPLLGVDCV